MSSKGKSQMMSLLRTKNGSLSSRRMSFAKANGPAEKVSGLYILILLVKSIKRHISGNSLFIDTYKTYMQS